MTELSRTTPTGKNLVALSLLALSAGSSIGLLGPISSAWMKFNGLSDVVVGSLSTLYFVAAAFGGLLLAPMAINMGLGRGVSVCCLFGGLGAAMMPWSTSAMALLPLRAMAGAGAGALATLGQFALGHVSRGVSQGMLTGGYALLFGVGLAAGPALGTPLYLRNPTAAFAVAAALLCNGGLALWISAIAPLRLRSNARWRAPRIEHLQSLHAVFAYGMAEAVLFSMLPVYLSHSGRVPMGEMGGLLLAFVAGGLVATLPISYLGDKWNRATVMSSCALAGVACSAAFFWAGDPTVSRCFAFLSGATIGPLYALALAAIGQASADGDDLSVGTIWFNAAFNCGCIVGPVVSSLLMTLGGGELWFALVQATMGLIPLSHAKRLHRFARAGGLVA